MYGQNYKVKGIIIDENKHGLEEATVVLLEAKDSTLIGFCVTNEKGEFLIQNVPPTSTLLQITFIGYGTIEKNIDINGEVIILDLGPIQMFQDASLLKDVHISADYVPIKIIKDTIEFNAEAFKVQPNANVEELLKKLPGVDVDNAGTITVKGEEVKAVTVDGKDFFGKDPKIATRNLPADAVNKVQIFDKKSKNSQFTGVDDGQDEKTINLQLKEDRKNGVFGNTMAGYGTTNRFESKGIINRFSKKYQFSLIGNANNLNQVGISAGEAFSLGGASRSSVFNSAPINWGGANAPGDIKSGLVGVNFSYDFTKKTKINTSYYLSGSDSYISEKSFTNTFLSEKYLISQKINDQNSNQLNHTLYSTADIDIDSLTEMSINVRGSYRDTKSNSTLMDTTSTSNLDIINRNDQKRNNDQLNYSYSADLSVRRKFKKKGRNMSISGNYSNSSSEVVQEILSSLYDSGAVLNITKSIYQYQDILNQSNNYSTSLTYNEPLNAKWTSSTKVAYKNNLSDQIKDFFDLDPANTSLRTFNESLSRAFDNNFHYLILGETFRYNLENFSVSAGVDYQNSRLEGIPSTGERISNPYNYFLPNANIVWDKPSIRLNYSTSIKEPSINQLQPIVVNEDPLNIYIGNPNLKPEYSHNIRLNLNHFDQFNFRSIFLSLRYSYIHDPITTATAVDPFGIRSRRPENTPFESTISSNINYSTPLNFIKAKMKVGANASISNGINIINSVSNNIDLLSEGFTFTLENKNKKHIDISGTTRLSWNQNNYKNNPALNTSFINQNYDGTMIFYPGKGWSIESNINYNIYDQGSFSGTPTFALWNASISKLFLKNKWQLKLRTFDILDQNRGIDRQSSEFAISETISNTIGRHFMVTVLYDIKSFAQSNSSNQMIFISH
jgi:hypothetical protein